MHNPRSHTVVGFIAAAMLCAASAAPGGWISLGGAEGAPVAVRLLESSAERSVVEITLPGFHATPVSIDGRTCYRLSLPGESNLFDAGLPELPHICRSLILPEGASPRAAVLEQEVVRFPLPAIPSKGSLVRTVDPERVPFAFSPRYGAEAVWPPAPVRLGEPYILRDYRGVALEALPFRQLAGGTLEVASRMVIEVVSEGLDSPRSPRPPRLARGAAQDFTAIHARRFLNHDRAKTLRVAESGEMLIVCGDAFVPEMAPFIEWKNQSGIPTTLVPVSEIGNDAASIREFVRWRYEQDGIAYLLLVGDAEQVATPSAFGGSSDPTYGCLDGDDVYPDLIVGRFSAETAAELQTQVRRSLEYEQGVFGGGGWLNLGTGVASADGPGDDGERDYQHLDVIRTKLLNFGYTAIDQIYAPGATAQMITDALNAGRGIVNYTGVGTITSWSTTGFSNAHIAALANPGKLPFILSIACWNGKFAGTTCFAEAWMRATAGGEPTGAVAVYMSAIAQPWNPPMSAQDEMIDLLVAEQAFTYGGLCYNGSCKMLDEYGGDGGKTFVSWHLFGDPSLLIRTSAPQAMAVEHDGSIPLGAQEYAVRVPGVAGARCALYGRDLAGAGALFGAAITGEDGSAVIALDPALPEVQTLTLTAVAPNRISVQVPVEVAPAAGPYVVLESHADVEVLGDGDGWSDAGERVESVITLKNSGGAAATSVRLALFSEDSLVTVQTGEQELGTIAAGGSLSSPAPFVLRISPQAPDGRVAALRLEISAVEGAWTRPLSLEIGAARLVFASLSIDDGWPLGNATGWVEPGETVEITLTLRNAGHADVHNAVLTARCYGGEAEVLLGTAGVASISAGGEASFGPLRLRVAPDRPSPSVIPLSVRYAADFRTAGALAVEVPVGGFVDDCETQRGWTCGVPFDEATSGLWTLGDPSGTTLDGEVIEPSEDHTPAPGSLCYVTGPGSAGGDAFAADLDGGQTTLLSPVFDLTRASGASLRYWLWFATDAPGELPNDVLRVEATADGSQWVELERVSASTGAWVERSFDVADFVPFTGSIRFRFIAEDAGTPSLVEALIDDVTLEVNGTVNSTERGPDASLVLLGPAPNPLSTSAELGFALPKAGRTSLEIFDVTGRLVRTLLDAPIAAGDHALLWDRGGNEGRPVPSGVYFVRLRAGGSERVRSLTVIE